LAFFVYCLIGLGISIKHNYPLWINPVYTVGEIVDYREVSRQTEMNNSFISTTAKLPVVEFRNAENTTIQFTDNVGNRNANKG
jgi:hypothetical protein